MISYKSIVIGESNLIKKYIIKRYNYESKINLIKHIYIYKMSTGIYVGMTPFEKNTMKFSKK